MPPLPAEVSLDVGEIVVSGTATRVSTILGSCVAIFLFSERRSVGGVIHFALPKIPRGHDPGHALRYGPIAFHALMHELTSRYGVAPAELLAKIVGGAAESGGGFAGSGAIAHQNVLLARRMLRDAGISVAGESPASGKTAF